MSVSLIDGHIDDDVMTDEQIIKALDGADVFLRNRANSEPAPLNEYDIEALIDIANACDEAANLINRQKAGIERLEKGSLKEAMTFNSKTIAEAKAEAIKEFAERLKENKIDIDVSFGYGREVYTEAVAVIEIDNLVKEMVGEG